MKLFKAISAAGVGLALSAATSQATMLNVGGSGTPGLDLDGGTVQASLLNQTLFQTSGTLGGNDGTISSWVVTGDASNPYTGGLTFVYQIHNNSGSGMDNVALNGFLGLTQVDVNTIAQPAYGSVAGTYNSSLALFDGSVVTFEEFALGPTQNGGTYTGVASGAYSYYLVVNTAATVWETSFATTDDMVTTEGAILAVPEPSAMIAAAMLLFPFGLSTLRSVRKSRVA